MEQLVNLASTTLASGINNSITSLSVTSATPFPTTGNFRITIDSEILLVTGVSGTTFTVVRGSEGTTAASHSSGATVAQTLTAGSVRALFNDALIVFSFATPPSNNIAGRTLICSELPTVHWLDTGSAFHPIIPVYSTDAFSFTGTSNNLGTTGVDTDAWLVGGVLHVITYNSISPKFWYQAKPVGNYKATLAIRMDACNLDTDAAIGIILYGSGGTYRMFCYNAGNLKVNNFNSDHSFNSNSFNVSVILDPSKLFYLQFEDNGSNFLFKYSMNGVSFHEVASRTRNEFVTVDDIGFGITGETSKAVTGQCLSSNIA